MARGDILALFFILGEAFSLSSLSIMLNVGSFVDAICQVKKFFFYFQFGEVFFFLII